MDELLIPRVIVQALYPNCPFKKDDILTERKCLFVFPAYCDDNGEQPNWIGKGEAEKYPHIFRRIQWWEYLDDVDIPEYLKFKNKPCFIKSEGTGYGGVNKALYVKWFQQKKHRVYGIGALRATKISDLIPATQQEYEAYINGK